MLTGSPSSPPAKCSGEGRAGVTEEPGGSLAVRPTEDLESPGGKAQLVPGASGMPSPHPQVAQPFPQRHACRSLTWG